MIEYKHVALVLQWKRTFLKMSISALKMENLWLLWDLGDLEKDHHDQDGEPSLEPTDGNIYMDGKRIKEYDEQVTSPVPLCASSHCPIPNDPLLKILLSFLR